MEREQEELLDELLVIQALVKENPCRMKGSILKGLTSAFKMLVGSHLDGGASREQASRYLQRDVRTLTRWKQEYDDFPQARHDGHKEVSYDWVELIRWKMKHKDLYKED